MLCLFGQADLDRHWMEVLRNGQSLFLSVLRELLLSESDRDYSYLVEACHLYRMWSSCSRPNQTGTLLNMSVRYDQLSINSASCRDLCITTGMFYQMNFKASHVGDWSICGFYCLCKE